MVPFLRHQWKPWSCNSQLTWPPSAPRSPFACPRWGTRIFSGVACDVGLGMGLVWLWMGFSPCGTWGTSWRRWMPLLEFQRWVRSWRNRLHSGNAAQKDITMHRCLVKYLDRLGEWVPEAAPNTIHLCLSRPPVNTLTIQHARQGHARADGYVCWCGGRKSSTWANINSPRNLVIMPLAHCLIPGGQHRRCSQRWWRRAWGSWAELGRIQNLSWWKFWNYIHQLADIILYIYIY